MIPCTVEVRNCDDRLTRTLERKHSSCFRKKNQSKKCRHKADSVGALFFSYISSSYFYKIIVSMSAARSTNLESILIFATCVLHRSLDFIKFTDRQDLEKYFFVYISLLISCMIKCSIGNKSVYRLCV